MTRWYDQRAEDPLRGAQLDFTGLFCPRCGCNDVEIRRYPRPATWFKASGQAICNECKLEFSLRATEPDGSPVAPREPQSTIGRPDGF